MRIKNSILYLAMFIFTSTFISCGDDEKEITSTAFTVTVENVSVAGTVDTDRAGGIVPLSPPVFALFTGDDPMFREGDKANVGTERIAEDGAFDDMVAMLTADDNVQSSMAVPSPGGPDAGGALFNGESSSFTFTADSEDDRLQFMTMMVQSNDWFYSFDDGGIELFDEDGNPISGDISMEVKLYDSGTEADTAPGTGPDQKPAQSAEAIDQGPKEDEDIEEASSRHSQFTIPANSAVVKVTISN